MSKPDVRAIVDVHFDFIVQNVSTETLQCHFTDGWGASSSDPKGQEGLQDCLLNRYQLCAQSFKNAAQSWFDFSVCAFRNQKETDTLTDDMKKFDATMRYCSYVSGQDYSKLKTCAESNAGAHLLSVSHSVEKKLNPDRAGGKIASVRPDWIRINGKDYGQNATADWLQLVCDAYTGSPKPASCSKMLVV